MVELMAEYSPPMPQPVKKRNRKKVKPFHASSSQRRRDEVDDNGDEEQFFASEPIGQPAEKQSADNGAEKVGAAGQSDLGIGEMKRRAVFQGRGDRARKRDLESVEIQVIPSAAITRT